MPYLTDKGNRGGGGCPRDTELLSSDDQSGAGRNGSQPKRPPVGHSAPCALPSREEGPRNAKTNPQDHARSPDIATLPLATGGRARAVHQGAVHEGGGICGAESGHRTRVAGGRISPPTDPVSARRRPHSPGALARGQGDCPGGAPCRQHGAGDIPGGALGGVHRTLVPQQGTEAPAGRLEGDRPETELREESSQFFGVCRVWIQARSLSVGSERARYMSAFWVMAYINIFTAIFTASSRFSTGSPWTLASSNPSPISDSYV